MEPPTPAPPPSRPANTFTVNVAVKRLVATPESDSSSRASGRGSGPRMATLSLRVPSWASEASHAELNSKPLPQTVAAGTYLQVGRSVEAPYAAAVSVLADALPP